MAGRTSGERVLERFNPSRHPPEGFGGSLAGWQALLTVHGTSILATQPLLVMDLSGQFASGQLTGRREEQRCLQTTA